MIIINKIIIFSLSNMEVCRVILWKAGIRKHSTKQAEEYFTGNIFRFLH